MWGFCRYITNSLHQFSLHTRNLHFVYKLLSRLSVDIYLIIKVVIIVVVGVDLLKLQNILINPYEINYVSMLIFLIFNVIVSGLINI